MGPLGCPLGPIGRPLGLLWGPFSGKSSKQMSQKPLQEALPTKTLKMEILRPPWEGKILHFHWRGVQKQRFAESALRYPTGPPKPPKTVTFGRLWASVGHSKAILEPKVRKNTVSETQVETIIKKVKRGYAAAATMGGGRPTKILRAPSSRNPRHPMTTPRRASGHGGGF